MMEVAKRYKDLRVTKDEHEWDERKNQSMTSPQ